MLSFLNSYLPFGRKPVGDHLDKIRRSKHYDIERDQFDNEVQNLEPEINKRTYTLHNLIRWYFMGQNRVPHRKLPQKKINMREFCKPSEHIKTIWLGHSSFLINTHGKKILVDPVLSGAASPVSFLYKRFQTGLVKRRHLKKVDYILISHDHYDHLDVDTIKLFKRRRRVRFIVPLGVGAHLKRWGIKEKRIVELDWWESYSFGELEFTATPAQHFSGRALFEANKTLWASWVIKHKDHSIFFSGDSGYSDHFKKIGEVYGPFDMAFIESGQYDEIWKELHLLPEQFLPVYNDLRAKSYFPIHWGMFELSFHPWYEPIEFLYKKKLQGLVNLVTPMMGEVFELNGQQETYPWWREAIDSKDLEKENLPVLDKSA